MSNTTLSTLSSKFVLSDCCVQNGLFVQKGCDDSVYNVSVSVAMPEEVKGLAVPRTVFYAWRRFRFADKVAKNLTKFGTFCEFDTI